MSKALGIAAQEAIQKPGRRGWASPQRPEAMGLCGRPSLTPNWAGKEEAGAVGCGPQNPVILTSSWTPGPSQNLPNEGHSGETCCFPRSFLAAFLIQVYIRKLCESVRRAEGAALWGHRSPSGAAQTRSQKTPAPSVSREAKFGWSLSSCRVSMSVPSATDSSYKQSLLPLKWQRKPWKDPEKVQENTYSTELELSERLLRVQLNSSRLISRHPQCGLSWLGKCRFAQHLSKVFPKVTMSTSDGESVGLLQERNVFEVLSYLSV